MGTIFLLCYGRSCLLSWADRLCLRYQGWGWQAMRRRSRHRRAPRRLFSAKRARWNWPSPLRFAAKGWSHHLRREGVQRCDAGHVHDVDAR